MKTINEYYKDFDKDKVEYAEVLRKFINKNFKELEERISWSMPTFYKNGNIIHFAIHNNHLGIYPGSDAMKRFDKKLKDYKRSKGAFQLPYDKKIPIDLTKEIIEFQISNINN